MTSQEDAQATNNQDTQQSALNKRLEAIGWGLFLIMIGGIWLVPDERVPQGTWLIGAGLIMLGINGVRYLKGIKTSSLTIVLGILALFAGLGGLFGVKPLVAILVILFGASIILKPLILKK